jgi:hypothetical protein
MNKSLLQINGEIDDVVKVLEPFTHSKRSKFFAGLGEYEIRGTEIGESAGEGLFVGTTIIMSENVPGIDDLNVLLEEYKDNKVLAFLETIEGRLLATNEGAFAV